MREGVKRRLDWPLLLSAAVLLGVGLFTLWSATSIQPGHEEFRKQLIWILVALPGFCLFLLVDPRLWAAYSRVVYVAVILLLLLVFLPGLGKSAGGAQRWVDLGPFQLQPSELAKLLLVLTLADLLVRQRGSLRTWKGLLFSFAHILPPFALVLAQPNLSTCLALFALWLGMSIVAGQQLRTIGSLALAGALAFGVAWQTGMIKPYQKERLQYFTGDLSFQAERSLMAVGTGQVIGEGIGRGSLKEALFVPAATTDFIFTVLGEESGFVGSVLAVAAYAFFLWRVWLVVATANVRLFRLIASGIFVLFSFHTLVNLLVVVVVLPVTGVPLPFMSYGGSAMALNLAMLGLLLNIRGREKHLLF